MPPTRRRALTTISATSTLGLAGCTSQIPGLQSNDNPEDDTETTDDNSNEEEQEQSNELGVRTGSVSADSFESTDFTGEVTGLGDKQSIDAGIQVKEFSLDDWNPTGDLASLEAETVSEPREYTWSYEQTLWGGGEHEYRAVLYDDYDDPLYGETKTFTIQDFDFPTPELEFGNPELTTDQYAAVEIPVENVSDVNNGEVRGDVQWFNSEGTFIGESYGRLHALKAGERGILTVSSYADGIEQSDIDDYEYQTRYNPVYRPAEGVEVVSSSGVTGTARNTVSDPPRSVNFIVRYFNSDGVLVGDVSDDVEVPELDAGREWEFEVNGQGEVSGEVDYSEILLLK